MGGLTLSENKPQDNMANVLSKLRAVESLKNGILFLSSGTAPRRYGRDDPLEFSRDQEPVYLYVTGIASLYDSHVAVDIASGDVTLFIGDYGADYQFWHGSAPEPEVVATHVGAKQTLVAAEDGAAWIKANIIDAKKAVVVNAAYVPRLDAVGLGDQEEAAAAAAFVALYDTEALVAVMAGIRPVKTTAEIEIMAEANKIACEGHQAMMRAVHPGMLEMELEAVMLQTMAKHGLRVLSYSPIIGSGEKAAILHYGDNDRVMLDGELVLIDTGCNYQGYASDITRTFPVNGKFTPDQRFVYETVLQMQEVAISGIKPGVEYKDLHMMALRVLAGRLHEGGYTTSGDVEVLMANRIPHIFFPHGLGHYIGAMTHDVGGYSPGQERSTEPGLKYLRLDQTLAAGNVITVEPGWYFIRNFVEPALENPEQAALLNAKRCREGYTSIGGVRIEDNVVVTETGHYNLTKVPKDVETVERLTSHAVA